MAREPPTLSRTFQNSPQFRRRWVGRKTRVRFVIGNLNLEPASRNDTCDPTTSPQFFENGTRCPERSRPLRQYPPRSGRRSCGVLRGRVRATCTVRVEIGDECVVEQPRVALRQIPRVVRANRRRLPVRGHPPWRDYRGLNLAIDGRVASAGRRRERSGGIAEGRETGAWGGSRTRTELGSKGF